MYRVIVASEGKGSRCEGTACGSAKGSMKDDRKGSRKPDHAGSSHPHKGHNRAYDKGHEHHDVKGASGVAEWERINRKSVPDSDGFMTDYTLYRNNATGEYICMFGDADIYKPDPDYADYITEDEDDALSWFDNYGEDEITDDVDASCDVTASSSPALDDTAVLNLLGRTQYDQLYKTACMKVDDEIVNAFGEVEIDRWTNGGCTAADNGDGTYTLTMQIYADFVSDRGRNIQCYGELSCKYDSNRPSTLIPEVTYFTDELDYE